MKLLSTFWIDLLSTLWVGFHSTLWIELLSPLWEELRTPQQCNRASWSSQDPGGKGPAAVGGGEGSLGTPKTLLQKLGGAVLSSWAVVSTHSPLWEELLSRATGLAGLPRTQETKGHVTMVLIM